MPEELVEIPVYSALCSMGNVEATDSFDPTTLAGLSARVNTSCPNKMRSDVTGRTLTVSRTRKRTTLVD